MRARVAVFALLLSSACGGADLTSSLIAHYALDGNPDEASNASKNGTMTDCSPAPDRAGTAGGAIRFDHAASVVSIGGVELTPPYSVALWFQRDATAAPDPACDGGRHAAI